MDIAINKNNEGVEFFFKKDYENAEKQYLEALMLDEKNTTALNNLGLLYHQQGKFDEATLMFQKAISIIEKDTYYLNLANSQVFLKKFVEAEQNYQKSLTINLKNENAIISLARLYKITNNPTLAIKLLEQTVKENTNIYFRIELSENYIATGKFEEALTVLCEIQSTGNSALVWNYIGICEFNLKNYGLAETSFKKSLALEPDHYNSRHFLALNYLSMGETEKAILELNFLIKMYPENPNAFIDKAVILINNGKYTESTGLIDHVLSINSQHERAIYYKRLLTQIEQKEEQTKNNQAIRL